MKQPHPLVSLTGIAANGCGLFVMPFVVGLAASLFFEVSEVADTSLILTTLGLLFIVPPLVLQFLGVVLKVTRERKFLEDAGQRTVSALLALSLIHI